MTKQKYINKKTSVTGGFFIAIFFWKTGLKRSGI